MKGKNTAVFLLAAALAGAAACDYKPRNHGRVLYEKHCQSCHMEKGQGLGALIPPVASADYVTDHARQLACIIRNGVEGSLTVNGLNYEGKMDGNSQLTDVEINNLVHYLLEVMNRQENPYTIKDIRKQLETCGSDSAGEAAI